MRLLEGRPLQLDVFAVTQGSDEASLGDALLAKCRHDARIRFLQPLASEDTVSRLRDYDAMAMPSQAMEPDRW